MSIADRKLSDEAGRLAALRRYQLLDTEPEREFDDIVALVQAIFGLPIVAISLLDTDRQWFKAVTGSPLREMPRSLSICHHTIQGTAPLGVEDTRADTRFAALLPYAEEGGLRCYLGVPLATPEGYNVGSLCVLGTEPRAFSPHEREVLARFARIVASHMELRMLARRDALTGALSRRAFGELLQAALDGARGGRAAALLLLDIDHFKSVNDRWGHVTGDAVIKAVVAELRRNLDGTARLGRLGGEEFAALLPDICAEAAVGVAQRLREGVANLSLPELGGVPVTVSCGVAPWRVSLQSTEHWLSEADAALYAAKKAGRNRVVQAA